MFKDQISVSEARLQIARAAYEEAGMAHSLPERPVAPLDRVYLYASPEGEAVYRTDHLDKALKGVPHLTDWERLSQRRGLRYLDRKNGVPDPLKEFTQDEARSEWSDWAKKQIQDKSMIAQAAREEVARKRETERGIE